MSDMRLSNFKNQGQINFNNKLQLSQVWQLQDVLDSPAEPFKFFTIIWFILLVAQTACGRFKPPATQTAFVRLGSRLLSLCGFYRVPYGIF